MDGIQEKLGGGDGREGEASWSALGSVRCLEFLGGGVKSADGSEGEARLVEVRRGDWPVAI